MMEEHELIIRCKQGDQEAFTQLVLPHQQKIQHQLFQLVGDEGEAEDLLQETLIQAYQHIQQFQEKSSFYTWLYRIARNRAISYIRKKNKAPLPFQEEILLSLAPQQEAPIQEESEQQLKLKEAIAQLPEKQRVVFELFIFQKKRQKEIAAELNVPEGTVRSRLFHARKNVEKYFLNSKS